MTETQKEKKAYIISKNVNPDEMREVIENFEDPSKYLSLDPRIVVGLLPFKSKKHPLPNNLTHQENITSNLINISNENRKEKEKEKENITSKEEYSDNNKRPQTSSEIIIKKRLCKTRPPTTTNKKNIVSSSNNINFITNTNLNIRPLSSNIHYQLKSKDELYDIFNKSKLREKEFLSEGTNKLIPSTATENVKENYKYQEKLLKLQEKDRIKSAKISKKLSKSCQRKEKDLLFNKIEEHRLKKQMIEILDHEKPIYEKYGNNYWMFSLRRPKHLDYIRVNYINVGTPEREIWKPMLEYPYKPVEIIQNPKSLIENKFSNVINEDYFCNETKRLNFKLPDMKGINEMTVVGKNLMKEEFKNLNELYENVHNDKVRLFKDPFEEKKNYMNDLICKQKYDKPNLQLCKCTTNSAKTIKKLKKPPNEYFY